MRRPESVLVIVYTVDEHVLLLKRTRPFEFWQSITGSLEVDEVPADAARRELLEETGFSVQGDLSDSGRSRVFEIDVRWRDRYSPGITTNTEYEWHYRLNKKIDVRIDNAEHSAWRWVSIDEAIDCVWSWTNKEALESLQTELRP